MKKLFFLFFVLLLLCGNAQDKGFVVTGSVTFSSDGSPLVGANVFVKGTNFGSVSNKSGRFYLKNLKAGDYTIVCSMIGFKTKEALIEINPSKVSHEINFELEEDLFNLSEVVVTSNRYGLERSKSPVVVTSLSPKLFQKTNSSTVGEGINYLTGLRFENNCQNCGFSQIRMCGMEGPYSQILINGHPIFSGLAGVYGLELIPQNMLEKVEVVKGGGSSVYGSNAIAGTINLIVKDPKDNYFEGGYDLSLVGDNYKPDSNINFNTSIVSDDYLAGMSIYSNIRNREFYDNNNDGYCEISPMKNIVIGTRAFIRPSDSGKLSVDFFHIKEQRDGGNKQSFPLHQRDVAEAVRHDIKTLGLTYDQYINDNLLSVYTSGQYILRDSYYGANQDLSSYGSSNNKTYIIGGQYKLNFNTSSLLLGFENKGDFLIDKKLGYPEYKIVNNLIEIEHHPNVTTANQSMHLFGGFLQYELTLGKFKALTGARLERYSIDDKSKSSADKSGVVFVPRANLMYSFSDNLQGRLGYSMGYRAPQIFDEDLHVETSGAVQIINENDPNLKQENSNSFTASIDYNNKIGNMNFKLLVEGFYTKLENPFANEVGEKDSNGIVIYKRVNATDGAIVKGININLDLVPSSKVSLSSGFTVQSSEFESPQQDYGTKRFYRSPNTYGFFTSDFKLLSNLQLAVSGIYTGRMDVPYHRSFDDGSSKLRRSPAFYDAGIKIYYDINLVKGVKAQFYTGIKNMFNSYQSDFDKGIDRDPEYIYGPISPRAFYLGVKFGSL